MIFSLNVLHNRCFPGGFSWLILKENDETRSTKKCLAERFAVPDSKHSGFESLICCR